MHACQWDELHLRSRSAYLAAHSKEFAAVRNGPLSASAAPASRSRCSSAGWHCAWGGASRARWRWGDIAGTSRGTLALGGNARRGT